MTSHLGEAMTNSLGKSYSTQFSKNSYILTFKENKLTYKLNKTYKVIWYYEWESAETKVGRILEPSNIGIIRQIIKYTPSICIRRYKGGWKWTRVLIMIK